MFRTADDEELMSSLMISCIPEGSRSMARKTSRHMTLPDPSQIELTGASLYIRAIGPVST